MATKNSILLIVKQSDGINYNELLTKTSADYSSVNSARAALSRALKDMSAIGLVARVNNRIYITEKGTMAIGREMKHKLLMKLNATVNSKESHLQIDYIVQDLHALIERSKQDSELLHAARGSVDFYIKDLEQIQKKTVQRIKQLDYLNTIFLKQVETLKEMDFNDLIEFQATALQIKKIVGEIKFKSEDVVVGTSTKEDAELLAEKTKSKAKKNSVTLKINQLKLLPEIISGTGISQVRAYLGSVVISFVLDRMVVYGPYSVITKLHKLKKYDSK